MLGFMACHHCDRSDGPATRKDAQRVAFKGLLEGLA